MILPDQIPAEAVRAAWQAMMAPDALAMHRAIAAALNAWPGGNTEYRKDRFMGYDGTLIILPLPHEEGELKRLGPEFEAAIFSDVDGLYEADKSEGEA